MTLTLPDYVVDQLQIQARMKGRSVAEVASQLLTRTVPPPVEDDLPPALRAELQAMSYLSDDTLWQIAGSKMNEDKVALYDVLLQRHSDSALTPEGRAMLADLSEEADVLMLRKAQAYALLKSRGHRLPTLEELHEQYA